jgi:uncharacterized protein YndB with AHSA1/START domain
MSPAATNRIERRILLQASRARVWLALTDAREFGHWFQAQFTGPFRPGARAAGRITSPDHEGLMVEFTIEELLPERRFSYRWHPNAVEAGVDYSREPTTLVTFTLADATGGTLLTVVESGFEQIPLARRAEAVRSNQGGWSAQVKAIEAHLGRDP